ncbi:MAG TPA: amylo-alpha-1,6-glucosidase [Thermoanaerobaculia bacterium]|nr:amylo-alpha-1,6-glucosidase [Thermoanaerobaculia bacterium]
MAPSPTEELKKQRWRRLGREVLGDFASGLAHEWLETNGIGGWASSTANGAHSRRYHGLLVAATEPPAGRVVLLSRLDETLKVGHETVELSCRQHPGTVHPRGFEWLAAFRRALFPSFDYETRGARLRKTIAAVAGENTTLVLYELLAAEDPVELVLRPFFAGRDFHSLAGANAQVRREGSFSGGRLAYRQYDSVPEVFIAVTGGAWTAAADWYYDFEYASERERGLDYREDLFTPGTISATLVPGARLGVIISTDDPAGRDAFLLLDGERRRREEVLRRLGTEHPFCRALALAADQFLVRRGAGLRTVIAGYHWFGDWGRDTMIALPGLCLVTGRHDEAKSILRAFAAVVDQGMLPNRFPDRGQQPEYNAVDASLWFFVAVHRYLAATGDEAFVSGEMLPVLEEILAWHRRGTRHGIRQDGDGLLASGEAGFQLTWMDVKVGEEVITPRQGKPVEIQALWYNALQVLAALRQRCGQAAAAAALLAEAARVQRRFGELFWNEAAGFLNDVVDEAGLPDPTLRPNQLLALSLPFPLLEGERAERILRAVEERLLTPVGLRTLSPGDPRYRPAYRGAPAERDPAYHQGTVWPWLFGPYLTALVRVRGAAGRATTREILSRFAAHLGEAGVGSVGEIFDADPPHIPRGCIAQAWSVAEVLRAAIEEAGL